MRQMHNPLAGDRASAQLATTALMCYNEHMDSTIRNLDEKAYRELKARAVLEGKTVGEAVNEAIRAYVARPRSSGGAGSLLSIAPEPFPRGNEKLSEEVDAIVYGKSGKVSRTRRR